MTAKPQASGPPSETKPNQALSNYSFQNATAHDEKPIQTMATAEAEQLRELEKLKKDAELGKKKATAFESKMKGVIGQAVGADAGEVVTDNLHQSRKVRNAELAYEKALRGLERKS